MKKIVKRKASKDLYKFGLYTTSDNKSGVSHDRSKPSPHGDTLLVKKGEYYYMWSIYGEKKPRISKTYPNRRELTNNYFKLAMYEIEDLVTDYKAGGNLFELIDRVLNLTSSLIDLVRNKKKNIPNQFKKNKNLDLLEKRIYNLEKFKVQIELMRNKIEDNNSEQEKNIVAYLLLLIKDVYTI